RAGRADRIHAAARSLRGAGWICLRNPHGRSRVGERRRIFQRAGDTASARRQSMATSGPASSGARIMTGPQVAMLPDGKRLHLNHGPIDLIVEAFGDADEIRKGYHQAEDRFATVLEELVEELPHLRCASSLQSRIFAGPVARRMERAVSR